MRCLLNREDGIIVASESPDRTMGSSVGIELQGLTKTFTAKRAAPVTALHDVSLRVESGEIVALLGPSGCGKTTTLRCLAGLEEPDSGAIRVLGTDVFDASRRIFMQPERRRIGMVFQSYGLWPHMSVGDNVAYPLRRSRTDRSAIEARVFDALSSVDCRHLADRYPGQLSGGQQQRIALARAIIANPSVILFDEPLSNLDAQLREQMRFELLRLHESMSFTSVYVTHDQEEAMTVASRIAVMRSGRILQLGRPEEIYETPTDLGVAEFMGSATFLGGHVTDVNRGQRLVTVTSAVGRIDALDAHGQLSSGDTAYVCVRPERVTLDRGSGDSAPDCLWVDAEVRQVAYQGAREVVMVDVNQVSLRIDRLPQPGDRVYAGDRVRIALPQRALAAVPPARTWADTTAPTDLAGSEPAKRRRLTKAPSGAAN